jgi:hypothetical protein
VRLAAKSDAEGSACARGAKRRIALEASRSSVSKSRVGSWRAQSSYGKGYLSQVKCGGAGRASSAELAAGAGNRRTQGSIADRHTARLSVERQHRELEVHCEQKAGGLSAIGADPGRSALQA